jgi:hypothetical protein
VQPSEVMAIAYLETLAIPWYCTCSKSDAQELAKLPLGSDFLRQNFLSYIRVRTGPNKGKIPRFRFNSYLFELVSADESCSALTQVERIILSCMWGMFMKPGITAAFSEADDKRLAYLERFWSSQSMQIDLAIRDLDELIAGESGSFRWAAARYRRERLFDDENGYGEKAERLAGDFLERGCI